MSISTRSTKAAMYSEIERLRALLDQRDLQIANQAETIRRRDAKIEALSAPQPPAPQPSAAPLSEPKLSEPKLSERGLRNELMRRLAITCKASVKWVDGAGFRQYKDGNWVAVPTHTIEFVSKGLAA